MTKGQATATLILAGVALVIASVNLFVSIKMAMGLQGVSDTAGKIGSAAGDLGNLLGRL